jgi:Polyprenyl synthetase
MNAISIGSLTENIPVLGADLSYRIFHEAQHLVLQSVEGQALELGWTRDNAFELSEDDYLRMVLKKTCWYTCIHPCRIGALIGTAGAIDADRFNLFGFLLGAAFQIQDDILNLVGDRAQYSKEILGDIWRASAPSCSSTSCASAPLTSGTGSGASSPLRGSSARTAMSSGSSDCSSGTRASTSRAPLCGRWSRRRWTSSTSPTAMRGPRRIATSFVT